MKILNALLLVLVGTSVLNAQQSEENDLIQKAREIHKRVITIDTHCDINVANFTPQTNYTQDLPNQVTLPKMERGGLDVAWFIVYTGQDELDAEGYQAAYENAMSKFEAIHNLVNEFAPDQIGLATTSEEVRRLTEEGKMVAMIGVENGYPIGTDLSNVEKFYDLGARYMSLSHQGHSQLSDSNTGESDGVWLHQGLSELGKEVIREMNRVGMMIDVSHPSKESIRQMFELSEAPLMASHSSSRELCDHSRNLDDEQLQWIKESGGVVQTVAFASYVDTEKHRAFNEEAQKIYAEVADKMNFERLRWAQISALSNADQEAYFKRYAEMQEAAAPQIEALKQQVPPVDVSDFVDHVDYMVEKIGIEHVGISSDFDGGGGIEGWQDASETFNVTLELVKRGYSEEEIAMLWGENLLRVMDEVEAVAQRLQREG